MASGRPQMEGGTPDLQRLEKIKTEVFRRFRLPGALNGLGTVKKTIQDEQLALGKLARGPGAAY